MLYLLSKLIPVPMRSTYTVSVLRAEDRTEVPVRREHATWWQWRDRIFRHRVSAVA